MQTPAPHESAPRAHDRRDIRHLVVCGSPIRPHQSAAYLAARTLVARESSSGDDARIVLVTASSHEAMALPLDISVDVLPMFADMGGGRGWRIDRAIFAYLFASARPNTVFHVHDSRHAILVPILQGLRALGIAYCGRHAPEKGAGHD
jgi:hypothetical protein